MATSALTNQSQKQQLTKVGYELLGSRPSYLRLANAFLHVLNLSSKSLQLYQPVIDGRLGILLALNHICRGLANVIASAFYHGPRFMGDKMPDQVDVLFISHLNQPSAYSADSDQYFDCIPEEAKSSGLNSFVLLLNQCRVHPDQLPERASNMFVPRIVPAPYITAFRELLGFLQLLGSGLYHFFRHLRDRDSLRRRFGLFSALSQASARSLISLRLRTQIGEIIRRSKPRVVVFTFEGHPWERLLCQFVHQNFPEIRLVGYQHSLIHTGTTALTCPLPSDLRPDKILTSSKLFAKRLFENSDYTPEKITVVGSPKHIYEETALVVEEKTDVLVLPEGNPEEALPMASFAIALAEALSVREMSQRVRLRLHPSSNMDWLQKELFNSTMPFPKNFDISTTPLSDDAERARWILYRGSTAMFSAVPFGGTPIYLDLDDNMLFNDPLASVSHLRDSASSVDAVLALIESCDQDAPMKLKETNQELISFVKSCFEPLSREKFLSTLEAAIRSG